MQTIIAQNDYMSKQSMIAQIEGAIADLNAIVLLCMEQLWICDIHILDFFNTPSFVKVFNTFDSFMKDFPK